MLVSGSLLVVLPTWGQFVASPIGFVRVVYPCCKNLWRVAMIALQEPVRCSVLQDDGAKLWKRFT